MPDDRALDIGSQLPPKSMGVTRRILKRAMRWHVIASDLKPLRERRRIGRALSFEEKTKLLNVAG